MTERQKYPLKNSRCPSCNRRGSLVSKDIVMDTFEHAEVCTWQCIYCGTVSEPKPMGKGMMALWVEQIVLAPGTFG